MRTKNLSFPAILLLLSCLISACQKQTHFLKEAQYRQRVEKDFGEKKKILNKGDLFRIFETPMSLEEREAMTFLYAYMTTGDISDYSGDFYLKNIRSSLNTRKESSWGKQIPDIVFRHFVLPVRVNNENLDESRMVFHKELWERVKNLSMYDAVLEVNHWCHEKAVYTPSDSRTSSPLSTVRTAYGRCGEESTFLVAALRSVGIPARQVYTPRWAHTDDNHAWVEAWVDGKWYFLGACEPEPVLNLGWFNAPASRGMLMHTKVFGAYSGPEEIMKQTANYTEINVIDNYAQHATVNITVTDSENRPVPAADIEYKIYNYAEFFTVAHKKTDEQGRSSLSAGLGDMLVYASANGKFGFKKISFGKEQDVTVVLDKTENQEMNIPLDIVPPAENVSLPDVSDAQRAENTRRMNTEDSIRNAYTSTFPSSEAATSFAKENRLDEKRTAGFILASRGNYQEIMKFLKQASENGKGKRALDLLSTISSKDLRDTPCAILNDHLYNTDEQAERNTVLSPRISYELLSPYRSFLQKNIPAALSEQFKKDPQTLARWCQDSITIRDDLNTIYTIDSPIGVWKSRVTDSNSREVFFIAAARSLGIPAWKDAVTGNLYYKQGDKNIHVDFTAQTTDKTSTGILKANYKPIPRLTDPKYYTHFTISKYENGKFKLLTYGDNTTWKSLLAEGTRIEAGYYALVTGSRMANGSVLSNISFFTISEGKTTTIDLVMRDNSEDIRIIGNFNSESEYSDPQSGDKKTILSTTGRGYFIVGILGVGQEPTNHALKDIEIKKDEFEKWGRKIVLLFTDEESYKKFDKDDFPNLPSTICFGIDTNGNIRKQIAEAMKLKNNGHLPIFIIGDTFNRVVFESDGYTIGLGEQLIHTIKGL